MGLVGSVFEGVTCRDFITGMCPVHEAQNEEQTQYTLPKKSDTMFAKPLGATKSSQSLDSANANERPCLRKMESSDQDMGVPQPPSSWDSLGSHSKDLDASATFNSILAGLRRAEERFYGEAFRKMAGGREVNRDSEQIWKFIIGHSALAPEKLDDNLPRTEVLSENDFLEVLREGAADDGKGLSKFMSLSGNGESLSQEQCRAGLKSFGQQELPGNFPAERWEHVLNVVMMDTGKLVSLEQWLSCCKMTGRIAWLVKYCDV
mmetsp:Transcript_56321/g.150580  ORF Transcript_56321/g.150580 Transcript_56321/m.150580 type:complete len:262 (-) Transcript_56321:115-900(-)